MNLNDAKVVIFVNILVHFFLSVEFFLAVA